MRRIEHTTWLLIILTIPAFGQTATQPANAERLTTAPSTTQPQSGPIDEVFEARVLEVTGKAYAMRVTTDGKPGERQPIKVGDMLAAGTRIRTGIRSRVVLAFGSDSVAIVQQLTHANIDQFHRSGDTKVVRFGLGHGAVRAGVAETTLRSDMTIATPTATLSKRGTIDFGMQYEPSTGRFRIFLDQEGLVEALNERTRESRVVRPGQYVTQAMRRWIENATRDRWVPVIDTYGQTDAEEIFNMLLATGSGVADPGGGAAILTFSHQSAAAVARELAAQRERIVLPPKPDNVVDRPEGNFGTGRGGAARSVQRARH